jgi:hypothetical protein
MQTNFTDQYKAIDAELQKYKDSKLKKIDENIFKILELVSVEAFGRTVNLETSGDFIDNYLKELEKSLNG